MSATGQSITLRTFYRDDPDGGERLQRAVYSEADAVAARFDGYFPDPDPDPEPAPAPAKAATKPAASSSSTTGN